jgi:hypothetical protein
MPLEWNQILVFIHIFITTSKKEEKEEETKLNCSKLRAVLF